MKKYLIIPLATVTIFTISCREENGNNENLFEKGNTNHKRILDENIDSNQMDITIDKSALIEKDTIKDHQDWRIKK